MKRIHLIGIGGIGMSALARILLKRGVHVSGSDFQARSALSQLAHEGAVVFNRHDPKHVHGADQVVYSTDISKDNVEYCEALRKKIPLLHRSELLAQLLEGFAPLLVTGTHGKTTTVSILAHLLVESGLDPSYAIGGHLNGVNSNGRYGKGLYFAVEADESDGSFLKYPSFSAIITNIEHDHMDYWKSEEALLAAFRQFASQVGSKKHLFWCYDDPLLRSLNLDGYSYGFHGKADLVVENFQQDRWKVICDIAFEKKRFQNVEIPLIGAHNVLNAAAAFGLALKLDIGQRQIRRALQSFRGIGRRVEKKGVVSQVEIYDDYAHHPTEIFSTLRALKLATGGKKIVLAFQPHRYSRTQYCMGDFADAFEYADRVVLTDIYAAREAPIPNVTAEKLLERVKADGYGPVSFVPRADLVEHLAAALQPGDVLITMGAGDITTVGPAVHEAMRRGNYTNGEK